MTATLSTKAVMRMPNDTPCAMEKSTRAGSSGGGMTRKNGLR